MPRSTYFIQECPTCGRTLQVRVEFLGKKVACRHCRGEFPAHDPDDRHSSSSHSGLALLRRADELLESVDERWLPPG